MTDARPPWKLRAVDFSSPGWHVRQSVGYELMFEFLRLSPSYEMARREAQERLSAADRGLLPRDFEEVRRTYALLGNVQNVIFRTWWLERGLRIFGNAAAKPQVHELSVLAAGRDIALADVIGPIERYLEDARRDEGLAGSLLLAVPIGAKRSEILRHIGVLLDQHEDDTVPVVRPVLKLQGQRLRAKVLFNGIRLLWIRAARPKWELWRLGAKAKLSPTYSAVLNPDASRKVKDVQEMIDREMMSKITHRALIKFEAIAENAARGRFPTATPVDQVPFDYPQLAKVIQRRNAWETKEKARVLKELQLRAARYAAAKQAVRVA